MSILSTESETKSWTDDLPVCDKTGAGFSTNQIYKDSGTRQEGYKFRDRSAHFEIDKDTSLYLIFSGHNGHRVADFALQKIAAEIGLDQLSTKSSEDEVKQVLRQAFAAAENGYMDLIDELLAQKTILQCEMPEELDHYQKYQELNRINGELSIGSSAVVALTHCSKLYICNIGNCRALLCKNDANNVLRVVPLSVDHNLYNEDELLRLKQLGLNVDLLKESPLRSTRCIGSYLEKGGYRDCEFLSAAASEPVISQPEIVGAIPLDDTCRFLLLMSNGLCNSLNDMFGQGGNQVTVNREIVQMTVEQFRVQSTLMGVSQSVVDKVAQLHHDAYMRQFQEGVNRNQAFTMREDITLLVRNFNFPMPNLLQRRNNSLPYSQNTIQSSNYNSIISTNNDTMDINTNSSGSSTDRYDTNVPDPNKKVKPYVDFSDYHHRIEEARARGTLPKGIQFD